MKKDELQQQINALQRSRDVLEDRVREGIAELARSDAALQAEIRDHAQTGADLAGHRAALAAVYRIATSASRSIGAVGDQVVLNLAELLGVPSAVILQVERNEFSLMSRLTDGTLSHDGSASLACGPCAVVCRRGAPHQCTGALRERFAGSRCFQDHSFSSFVGVPVKDSAGTVTGILCAMDYEERVFRSEEIQLIEIFARYVANEFERDVAARDLVKSQRFEALGQLTSGVAHEVRNPINAILIMTEALAAKLGEAPEYAPYLERIKAQVNRLSSLMQDLLDLAKPLRLSGLERRSLATICADAIEQWRQSRAERGQAVRLAQAPGAADVVVLADAARLEQVFVNLIDNAAQHSSETDEILLSILPSGQEAVHVQVLDRGSGLPAENVSWAFEPFFSTRKHGTGLGLSLVKHIVEAHEGEVELWNNEPPPGCTVEVRLPVAKEAEA